MLFNSLTYFIFLGLTATLYWSLAARWRPALLVAASAVFYGWWDVRLLGLMAAMVVLNFALARGLDATCRPAVRRAALWAAVAADLGLLGVMKYHDFFARSLAAAATALTGADVEPRLLGWVLPVGISFYTFQLTAYAVDLYRRRIPRERSLVRFAAFVSFFPQLVAGPIERAADLLPQIGRPRRFDAAEAAEGLRLLLWGLLKKAVLADNCAAVADHVFAPGAAAAASGADLWLGTLCFAFQIYGDFSGYSDMAVGSARLLGIRLTRNFRLPYFAPTVGEFWRRWHVSLMTWFKDYLYIPCGGSRRGPLRTARNRTAVFLVSGLWHGAAWHFVAWGLWHAALFPLDALARRLGAGAWLRRGLTLWGVVTGWVWFRAGSVAEAARALGRMASPWLWGTTSGSRLPLAYIAAFTLAEYLARRAESPLSAASPLLPRRRWTRRALYYALVAALFALGGRPVTFVYFQF